MMKSYKMYYQVNGVRAKMIMWFDNHDEAKAFCESHPEYNNILPRRIYNHCEIESFNDLCTQSKGFIEKGVFFNAE